MKNRLQNLEWKKWLKNMFIFSIPTLIALLNASVNGDLKFALGAGYSALTCSLIDLLRKYKDTEQP